MLFVQLTGMPGAGKSTIANRVKAMLLENGIRTEVLDGDVVRKKLWPDLGFSKEDRHENIRRLGFIANLLATNDVIAIMAAINPYEAIRKELAGYGGHVKTVWVKCDIATLVKRDPKQLYKKALLPDNHPDKINNLTGINDPYEAPEDPDLVIDTSCEKEEQSAARLYNYIFEYLPSQHNNHQ
jgi:adenylylsulfate kinase